MNRSRITGDLVSQNNIFVDIANDRVGIGSTIPAHKLSLPDSARISMGDSAEFQIYHNGSNSLNYIVAANNGPLLLRSSNADMIHCSPQGAVTLKHNGQTKTATTTYGLNVTGTTDTDGLVVSGITTSNNDIIVPTSMDSTESGGVAIQRFWSTGTITAGNVYKCGKWTTGEGTVQLLIAVRSHTAGNSGTTTYMYQGSFAAIGSLGIRRLMPLTVGTGHGNGPDNGTNSNAWEVLIKNDNNYAYEVYIHVPSGTNNKHFRVTVTEVGRGVTFTDISSTVAYSSLTVSSGVILSSNYNHLGNTHLRDNIKINLGNDDDLQLYHNSSSSYIDNNTNHLYLRSNVDGDDGGNIYLQAKSGENSIVCDDDGGVRLFYNNVEKAYTNSQGLYVVNTGSDAFFRLLAPTGYHARIDMTADTHANEDNYRIEVNTDQKFRVYGKPGGNYTSFIELDQAGQVTLTRDLDVARHLDVNGHTDLDNVSIAGVTTFTGDGIFNGGAGAIRIGGACDIRFTSGAWTGESVKLQYHNDKFYWQTGANGWQFRDAAGAATLELSPAGVISGKDLTFSSEIKANNGAGAIRILGGSDIRFNTGNWTGEFSGKLQYHSDKFYWQTGANGWQFRDSSGTATIELSPAGAVSGKNLTFAQDVSFSGGAGAATIAANSDIRLTSGNWTGNAHAKIQHHSDQLYISGGSSSLYSLIFRYNTQDRVYFKSDGTIWPQADSTSDLGTNDKRWANVYADTYYGDGSNLTGVTMTTINNNTNNYVITGTGTANTLQGESALTFSSGRLHSGAITLNDNGVSGALVNVRADDQGPWAFVVGNDTYHASSGLYGYQPNNGDFLLRLVGNSEYKSFTFEQFNGSTNRSWATFGNGGNVKLFYQGNERLATTTSGLTMGGTGAFIPPVGTTGQRPSGSTGMVRYNSTTGQLEVYNGSAWVNVNSQPFSGSGGSESLASRSGYKVHTFTSPGTFTVTGDDTSKVIEVLVIGGGGAGGEGGGGAGALRFSNSFPATPGNYNVTIGGGGSGNQSYGNNGNASSFGNITAPGGGGGGGSSRGNGNPGGSGGGCRRDNGGSRGNAAGSSGGSNNSNSPSSGWGNRGGSGNVGNWCGGGGGGGAGGVGGQGQGGSPNGERGGPGGSGLAYSINGSSTTRAGGGGGGCEGSGNPSAPGRATSVNGGGGRGGVSNQVPGSFGAQAGTTNTGGGGGGNASTGYSGGNHSGGSGIVIVAYTI